MPMPNEHSLRVNIPDKYKRFRRELVLEALLGIKETKELHKSKIEILKEEKHLVYGIVLKPDVPDTHGDIITKEEIEKSAHKFMSEYGFIGEQHAEFAKAKVVESYIAPYEMKFNERIIPDGAWVMVVKVFDDELWKQIKDGKYTSFSTGGFAFVQEIE